MLYYYQNKINPGRDTITGINGNLFDQRVNIPHITTASRIIIKIQKKPLRAITPSSSIISSSSVSGRGLRGLLRGGAAADSRRAKRIITNNVGIHATPQATGPTGPTQPSVASPTKMRINRKLHKVPQGPLDLKM